MEISSKIRFRLFEYVNFDGQSDADFGLMLNLIHQDINHKSNCVFVASNGFSINTHYYLSLPHTNEIYLFSNLYKMNKERSAGIVFKRASERNKYKEDLIQALKEWAK